MASWRPAISAAQVQIVLAPTGEGKEEIRATLAHTTTKNSDIYIKEVIPETSGIVRKLPW